MRIAVWFLLVVVACLGNVGVTAVSSDDEGRKPAASPTKKPSAVARPKRATKGPGRPSVAAQPAAAPVQAPAVPALPTNSNGVAAAAALPPPEVNPIEPAGDREIAAGFQARWWSHNKPSFCEQLSGDLPSLAPTGIDPRFAERWGRFASSLRTVIRDGESVNRFFELARVICPPEIYDEMAQDAFEWVVDARMSRSGNRINQHAERAADQAKDHAKELGCNEAGANAVYNDVRDNLIHNWNNELMDFVDDFNNDFRESWNRPHVAVGLSASALAALAVRGEDEVEDEEETQRGSVKKRARRRRSKSGPASNKKPRTENGKDSDSSGSGGPGLVL